METLFQPSRLLALPQELRMKVYEELLCPAPTKVHTLWHDKDGRQGSLDLHPSILRVDKQIYLEAVSLLYDENVFGIELTSDVLQDIELKFADSKPEPQFLFRKDASIADSRSDQPSSTSAYIPFESDKGVIYPHSFQRIRHIKLRTIATAMWRCKMMGGEGERRLSYDGRFNQLILPILQVLAKEQSITKPMQRTLHFEVVHSWPTSFGILSQDMGKVGIPEDDIASLLRLLGKVKEKRAVLVIEEMMPYVGGEVQPLTRVEVDVDARLALIA